MPVNHFFESEGQPYFESSAKKLIKKLIKMPKPLDRLLLAATAGYLSVFPLFKEYPGKMIADLLVYHG